MAILQSTVDAFLRLRISALRNLFFFQLVMNSFFFFTYFTRGNSLGMSSNVTMQFYFVKTVLGVLL